MWCLCTVVPENQLLPSLSYMTNGGLFIWVNIYLRSALFSVVTQCILVITSMHCVISQKSADLIYIAEEA
jgi:hypothetical protein